MFADQYGKNSDANNVKFDLDKNGKIDVEDFFIFADSFGGLIGDFDNNGCVDQKDLDLANNEIDIISKQFWFKIGTLDAFRGFDYYNVRYNGTDAALISQISALNQKYDLNKDGYVFSRPTDEGVGFIYWAKKDYDIFKSNLGAGCQKEIVQKPADLEIAKKPVDFDGMIFIFPDKQIRSFWNENTYLDIDVYWLDGEKVLKDGKNLC